MRFPCLFALAVALVGAPSAQTSLSYSTDRLVAPNDEVVVTNPTSGTVRLDSLTVAFAENHDSPSWVLTVEQGGTSVSVNIAEINGVVIPSAEPIGLDIPVGERATIRVDGYTPCIACRRRPFRIDTLVVYAGGAPVPDSLLLDTAGIVSSEDGPDVGPLRLSVAPNPSREVTRILVHATVLQPMMRVMVADALGREVAVVHEGPLPEGDRAFTFDPSRFPAGVYVVRATAAGASAVRRVIIVR